MLAVAAISIYVSSVITNVYTPTGTLLVLVNQPSATISIDGGRIRKTSPPIRLPAEIELKVGEHRVAVSKQGFRTHKDVITVEEGKAIQLNVELKPK